MQDWKHLFIIGAPKAGTSTLADMLRTHPDIHMGPNKEPRFFCDFTQTAWCGPDSDGFLHGLITREEDYHALYAEAPAGAWRLDGSTDYLANAAARHRIAKLAQSRPVKLICLLRDPVERVISEYRHTLRDMLEEGSLREALSLEETRRRQGWQPLFWHIRRSQYHADIKAYQTAFGDKLLLLDFAELRDQQKLMARVLAFLGLDVPTCRQNMSYRHPHKAVVSNTSHSYRSATLQRALFNPALRQVAQRLLPRPLRSQLWHRLADANKTLYQPSQADLGSIGQALAPDIRLCLADPTIPTQSWQMSRQLIAQLPDADAGCDSDLSAVNSLGR